MCIRQAEKSISVRGNEMRELTILGGLAVCALALSGCATNAGGYTKVEQVQTRLIGMSKEGVAMKLGAPTEHIALSPESEVWTYRAGVVGPGGGQCIVSVTLKGGVVVSSVVHSYDHAPLAAPLGGCRSVIGALD